MTIINIPLGNWCKLIIEQPHYSIINENKKFRFKYPFMLQFRIYSQSLLRKHHGCFEKEEEKLIFSYWFFLKLNAQLLFCLLKLFSIKINWNKTPNWCFEEEEERLIFGSWFFLKLNLQLLFCLLKLFSIKINWNKTPSWCFEEEEEKNDVEHDDENTVCIKYTISWYWVWCKWVLSVLKVGITYDVSRHYVWCK